MAPPAPDHRDRETILGPAAAGRPIDSTPADPRPCRTCGEPVDPAAPTAPFCSERCQGADLGRWFDESYRVSREIKDSDLDTVD